MPATSQSPVVVVTGASQGIGRVIALAFADTGARVVLSARNRDNLEETGRLISERGGEALVLPADVTSAEDTARMVGEAVQRLGGIDVLVCNSGIAGPTKPLWEITPAEWDETMDVNVGGVFNACRAALPGMIARGDGSVIVIGSMTGKRPLQGRAPYAASKLGLVGLVRTLAVDCGSHGVRVNLISPGAVNGPRIQSVAANQARAQGITEEEAMAQFASSAALKRIVEAEEVAAAAVFLASPAAGGISGEDLNVSAGSTMY